MTTLGEKLREAIEKKQVQATLNAWDKHEDQIRKPQTQEQQMANPNPVINHAQDKPHFGVSNNIMRTTFDHIKNNNSLFTSDHIRLLVKQGFKENSVTAVIYQLIRAGQVARDANGWLSVTQDAYTPIKVAQKSVKVAEQQDQRRKKVTPIKRREPSEGIAALNPDTGDNNLPNVEKFDMGKFTHHAPVQRPVSSSFGFHPSAIVDQLPVLHARELYDYLKKIFGGN